MRALIDINVLIALTYSDHVHHERAHNWWSEKGAGGWASCPLTENGFVRISSQLRLATPSESRRTFAQQTTDTDHEFWPDDLSIANSDVFDFDRLLGPKVLTDVYLLALAVRRNGCLVTFDRHIPVGVVLTAKNRHLAVL